MRIKERKTRVWNGTYRGVDFEINNFKTPPNIFDHEEKDNWTYYLILQLNKIPKENDPDSFWLDGEADDKGRVFYKYYHHNIINNIDFQGGCTWYSKLAGFDGANKVIKIGCDYQHSWNEGMTYHLDIVTSDVKNTIDAFLNFIPDYKYWCRGNGNLYSLNEGVEKEHGFFSNEYLNSRKNDK